MTGQTRQLNNLFAIFISFLVLTAMARNVYADHNLFDLPLSKLLEITVKGSTLTTESITSVPASVTVFNQSDIERLGFRYLYQLLQIVPGFQAVRNADNSAYSKASVRGTRLGSSSSELLLMVDGQRLNNPSDGGIGHYLEMPLYSIERVEFIRGPGAAIYGSNALMGTINIVSQSASRKVDYSVANFNGHYLNGLLHTEVGNLGIQLGASFNRSDGDKFSLATGDGEIKESRDFSQISQVSVDAFVGTTSFYFDAYRTQTDHFYVAQYFSPDVNHWVSNTYTAGIQHKFEFSQGESNWYLGYVEVDENASVQHFGEGYLSSFSSPASDSPAVSHASTNETQWSLNNNNQWKFNDRTRILFGLEMREIEIVESEYTTNYDLAALRNGELPIAYYSDTPPVNSILPNINQRVFGLYGQLQYQTDVDIDLTLGARYDEYPDANFDQISPRLGVVYTPSEMHSIKFLWGSAFRAPSVNELYANSHNYIIGSTELQPKTVTSFDAIWRMNFDELNISLGYFENQFDDAIVQQLNSEREREYVNSPLDDGRGVELELYYQLNSKLSLQVNGSTLLDNDAKMYREAKGMAAIISEYQSVNWNLNVVLRYVGSRKGPLDEQGNSYQYFPSYWVSSANFIYRVSSQVQLFITGNNIGDENISYPAQTASIPNGIPARGREIALGVEFEF